LGEEPSARFHLLDAARAASIGDEGLLVAPVEERTSDDFDGVVHDRPEGEPFERHQHSSHLIPSKGAAVDDQKWDFSASVRIPDDTAD
jgi:hypothetical protein